jgi:hypothetical protein
MRATWSTDPPGGNTEMSFTGFVGQVPWAGAIVAADAMHAHAIAVMPLIHFVIESSGVIYTV